MSKMILMQGIPGSGKSTKAFEIAEQEYVAIFSTDNFWTIGPGGKGTAEYCFDPARLGEAHLWNQQAVDEYMTRYPGETIIIDNTNIKRWQAEPYLAMAKKHGYSVEVVRVECDPQVAFERGTHNVPYEIVERMANEMEDLLPED